MSVNDTKERILEAAKQIFDDQGLEAVSLRAVTTLAGVNLAAVNYHFGSKAALLQAMAARFFTPVNASQLLALQQIEAREQTPSVEDLLSAYALPIFKLFDMARGREWMQAWMGGRSIGTPGGNSHQVEGGEEVTRRYYEALRQILPSLPPDELWWRFERARNLLMANQGRHLMHSPLNQERTLADERSWLLRFLAGGLQAPSSATPIKR